jgi:hypothetical protein
MTCDWLLRVGDGNNFIRSSKYKVWGVNSRFSFGKYFIKNVQPGDRLWFIKSKSKGKVLAVATYCSQNERNLGPLLNLTMSNEELGWDNEDTNWTSDFEIHYKELYNLTNCDLLTNIKSALTIRKYKNCIIDLETEYKYIVKYCKISFEM